MSFRVRAANRRGLDHAPGRAAEAAVAVDGRRLPARRPDGQAGEQDEGVAVSAQGVRRRRQPRLALRHPGAPPIRSNSGFFFLFLLLRIGSMPASLVPSGWLLSGWVIYWPGYWVG